MKSRYLREGRFGRLSSVFDLTTIISGLTALLFMYILYHIYPLISKGLFW